MLAIRTRLIFKAFLTIATICSGPATSLSQDITCRIARDSDTSFAGGCLEDDSLVGQLWLHQPSPSIPHLWVGTIRGSGLQSAASGGPNGGSEVGIDVRPGGALRLGRSWLALRDLHVDSNQLRFAFRFDRSQPANDVDVKILKTARGMLLDVGHWNRADTTDMAAAPTKGFSCAPARRESMFCAIYLASLRVAGDYAHFRPAVNAVRQSVNAASKRPYRHPLVDFNNDSFTTLRDVLNVLDSALATVKAERATGRVTHPG